MGSSFMIFPNRKNKPSFFPNKTSNLTMVVFSNISFILFSAIPLLLEDLLIEFSSAHLSDIWISCFTLYFLDILAIWIGASTWIFLKFWLPYSKNKATKFIIISQPSINYSTFFWSFTFPVKVEICPKSPIKLIDFLSDALLENIFIW